MGLDIDYENVCGKCGAFIESGGYWCANGHPQKEVRPMSDEINMNMVDALNVVLELAEQNALENEDRDNYLLNMEEAKQEAAIEMVSDLRSQLSLTSTVEHNNDTLNDVMISFEREYY
jgi:hypothetical protein